VTASNRIILTTEGQIFLAPTHDPDKLTNELNSILLSDFKFKLHKYKYNTLKG